MSKDNPHSTARADGSCDDCGSFHGVVGGLPWQSIDSAPRDGTEILCWCPGIGMRMLEFDLGGWKACGSDGASDYEPECWLIIQPPSERT